jgi:hypothetical protein
MLRQFKSIAFAFSDPAGANACLALSRICERENGSQTYLFSNRKVSNPLFLERNVTVTDQVPNLEALRVECLFTGTSHPSSSHQFELRCIEEARRTGIYTIAFVDHWTSFHLRFEGLDKGKWPDEIWVVDEKAKSMAENEGLPAERLKIQQSPYLKYLEKYWRSGFKGNEYLASLGIQPRRYNVLYAPDPISLRANELSFGFDEIIVLKDLMDITKDLSDLKVIVKAHPLQPVEIMSELVSRHSDQYDLVTVADNLELIKSVDVVIGFYSNLLLEANTIGGKVIRYMPGHVSSDYLLHYSQLPAISSPEALKLKIKTLVYESK